jgi:hypothetical protein
VFSIRILARLCIFYFLFVGAAAAQNWSDWLGPQDGVRLRVRLLNEAQDARAHIAGVEVQVRNVFLNYPDLVHQSGIATGVLEYHIDNCPPVVTTDTRLRFEHLAPGHHDISVQLLGADDRAISPEAKLTVVIP